MHAHHTHAALHEAARAITTLIDTFRAEAAAVITIPAHGPNIPTQRRDHPMVKNAPRAAAAILTTFLAGISQSGSGPSFVSLIADLMRATVIPTWPLRVRLSHRLGVHGEFHPRSPAVNLSACSATPGVVVGWIQRFGSGQHGRIATLFILLDVV